MLTNLIPAVTFILEQYENWKDSELISEYKALSTIDNYARILSTKPELHHFLPVKDGVVLEENECKCEDKWPDGVTCVNCNMDYIEAKSRCLFAGFEAHYVTSFGMTLIADDIALIWDVQRNEFVGEIKTIEDLTKYRPEVTQTFNQLIFG